MRSLAELREELDRYLTGEQTTWNQVHGSITGDYEGQALRTIESDNARIQALTALINSHGGKA